MLKRHIRTKIDVWRVYGDLNDLYEDIIKNHCSKKRCMGRDQRSFILIVTYKTQSLYGKTITYNINYDDRTYIRTEYILPNINDKKVDNKDYIHQSLPSLYTDKDIIMSNMYDIGGRSFVLKVDSRVDMCIGQSYIVDNDGEFGDKYENTHTITYDEFNTNNDFKIDYIVFNDMAIHIFLWGPHIIDSFENKIFQLSSL
jgi:hypothetical protein